MQLQYQPSYITPENYLVAETEREIKHELVNGEVYAMAGASKNHVRLVTKLAEHILPHLSQGNCEFFSSDLKVRIGDNFFYPDALVVCEDESGNPYYTENPVLLIEVLSKTTRRYDKTLKRTAYQRLPSVQEYVLIEQDFVEVEVCRREQHWQSQFYYLGDSLALHSIGLSLSVESLYARVENADMQAFYDAQVDKT